MHESRFMTPHCFLQDLDFELMPKLMMGVKRLVKGSLKLSSVCSRPCVVVRRTSVAEASRALRRTTS